MKISSSPSFGRAALRVAAHAALVFLPVVLGSARAAELNVSLTHVPLAQDQVRKLVSQALPPEFDHSFAPKQYAVHVLIDRHTAQDGREAVYLLMGLQHRLPDGRALQEHTYLSSLQFLGAGLSDGDRRSIIESVLAQATRSFAKSMMDNAARVR